MAAVLVVVGSLSAYTLHDRGSSGSSTLTEAPLPTTIAGVATSELVVDGMKPLACGGAAPLSALTAKGGAEKDRTPEAAGLRDIIAHDPTGGESPETPHNWVLMSEKDGTVTFGQRTGQVGIGAVVVLKKSGRRYTFEGSGGCGPIGYPNGQTAMNVWDYTKKGDRLDVDYTGGMCDKRPPSVHVHETAATVDVLVLNPPPLRSATGSCGGVGVPDHIMVTLDRPLSGRTVRNIGYLPTRTILSQAQAAA